jgi:hypothetical protein
MAIPTSGILALTDLQTEFGGSNPIGINEYYKGGGLVPNSSVNANVPTSGAISLSNFYGAQNRNTISITISSNTNNYNVYSNRGASYIAGISDIVVTINSGVVIGSSSTGSPAFTVSGFASGDTVSIINNGTIVGKGGDGGAGGTPTSQTSGSNSPALGYGVAGSNGGDALSISFATSITNNGIIAGGGGGGGGGAGGRSMVNLNVALFGGGGGGGGAGAGSGAAGGTPVQTPKSNGTNGSNGSSTSEGAGGIGGSVSGYSGKAGDGGAGGGMGQSGSSGQASTSMYTNPSTSGGSAGNYVTGNSNVTWVSNGTRLGGAS